MFRPNAVGKLHKLTGRDVHGREQYAAGINCPFAQVNLSRRATKTDRRADSSASRGSADEVTSWAKILVVAFMKPSLNDKFCFLDDSYRVVAVHPRRTVAGLLDHWELDLEVLPR